MKHYDILESDRKPKLVTRAMHRLQERIRQPTSRNRLSRLFARLFCKPNLEACNDGLEALLRDGYYEFPDFVAADFIDDISRELMSMKCFNPWDRSAGLFHVDDASPNMHVAQIKEAATLVALNDLAADQRLVGLASAYFGCRAVLDSIQAWWSLPGAGDPEEAENFHRDNDGIKFLKFFLYLSDVGDMNGPHVFIKGSHRVGKAIERRRYSDQEILQEFGSGNLKYFKAPAGYAFLEDTYGVHKGQVPKQGRRLLVQFRYCMHETVFRSPLVLKGEQKDAGSLKSLLFNH